MKLETQLTVNNSFNMASLQIDDGYDKYIRYLNHKLFESTKDINDTIIIDTEQFGKLKISYDIAFINEHDMTDIFIYIKSDNDLDEDAVYDAFQKDPKLGKLLEDSTIQYIDTINAADKFLIIPENATIVYKYDKVFIETIEGEESNPLLKWTKFTIFTDQILAQTLLDNMD